MPDDPDQQKPQERKLEAWETSVPGPYVTIRTGGAHDGVVTITATGSGGRVVVEATWGSRYARTSITAERVGHAAADELAHQCRRRWLVCR